MGWGLHVSLEGGRGEGSEKRRRRQLRIMQRRENEVKQSNKCKHFVVKRMYIDSCKAQSILRTSSHDEKIIVK